jgi:S1-C subfamily serine protease
MDLEAEQGTRAELERDLTDIQARYDSLLRTVEANEQELEARAASDGSGRNVAAEYSGGVGLIVYSYGFARRGTDELLRMQVDGQNQVMTRRDRIGRVVPIFDFGGAGEAMQRQGSATGFLVDSAGWVLTNRHVAEPWSTDDGLAMLRQDGWDVEPRFTTLQIYFPPGDRSYAMQVQRTSKQADVAILRTEEVPADVPVLQLAGERYLSPPGEEIVFIGYPTGVHNLMFRVPGEERSEILQQVGEGPVNLARELGRRNQIQPLVTGGSISDTTTTELIHTAEATGGGSGGPLITNSGSVVGIHYAAVRSPIEGDPFQTQRSVRITFGWELLPVEVRNKLRVPRQATPQR